MLFNSLEFLVFFPLVCIIYFLIQNLRCRNLFLLAASYYFYMCWKPEYALLLLTSTGITYLASLCIAGGTRHKKLYLILSLVLNLGILFFFKYYQFAGENITALLSHFGILIHVPEFHFLLPVGISFYIFQALGYSIDVYRGDVAVERNFFTYALFVSFFPQLVAGPIERSTNLLQQFHIRHTFDGRAAIQGLHLMLWGFFLKLAIADRACQYIDEVYNHMDASNGGSCLLASILFCFQLYGDFAGYSYIATGCAKIMGFDLMSNFRRPYFFSVSVQDFWKRNHISLTTWFMDYVYYPLVGSSINLYWWCFCIFFTFFLSGFWHGASWTYVISFSIFGIYLVACLLKDKAQRSFEKKHQLKKKEWWLWLNRGTTFLLVMLALVFFRANSVSDGFSCIEKIFGSLEIPDLQGKIRYWIYLVGCLGLLFVGEYIIEYKKYIVSERLFVRTYAAMDSFLFLIVLLFGVFDGGQFIYFQF